MITTPGHALQFGSLDLLGKDKSAGWWIEATGDDAEFGNPEAVVRAVTSFLMDGAVETTESNGNREMSLRLRLSGTTSANLALAESALVAETAERNTMVWTPPDNTGDFAGVPSVFEVVNSHLDFDFDDVKELQLQRIYVLTIKALPYARAAEPVTVATTAPIATTPVNTLVDDGSSTTNWAVSATSGSFGAPTLTTSGGQLHGAAGWPASTSARRISLTRTGLAASMASTPYVRVKMTASVNGGGVPSSIAFLAQFNGGPLLAPVARDGDYYWYNAGVATLNSVLLYTGAVFPSALGALFVHVDEVYRTDSTTLSSTTGQKQQFLNLPVAGSVRTQGSLVVQNTSSTSLGTALVYTAPVTSAAAQPPLRRLRSSGSTETTDSATVSGKYSALSTLHTFDIPSANVPVGGYVLMARIRNPSGTAYSVTWAGKSRQGTTNLDVNPPTGTTTGTLTGTNTWNVVTIGNMTLPTYALGTSGVVRIELQSAGTVDLDEAWLFNLTEGRLTVVECGTSAPAAGGSSSYLFIDSASLNNPTSVVSMGTQSDRSDAYGAGERMLSRGAHEFAPPSTNVFVVTTNSAATSLSLSSHPRFHTHVV